MAGIQFIDEGRKEGAVFGILAYFFVCTILDLLNELIFCIFQFIAVLEFHEVHRWLLRMSLSFFLFFTFLPLQSIEMKIFSVML
jgi:hypothetical protein